MSNPIDPRPHSIREAEAEYRREITDLREKRQAELEAAYRSGYEDGAGMARDDCAKETARLTEWLRNMAKAIADARAEWFGANERQAVELACAMLEQILGDRPAVYERIHHALTRAFEQLAGGDRVTIRCHPADLEFVQKFLGSQIDEIASFKRVRVLADEQIGVNGCLVETELGIVDARIEQQLALLRGALLDHAPAIGEAGVPAMNGPEAGIAVPEG